MGLEFVYELATGAKALAAFQRARAALGAGEPHLRVEPRTIAAALALAKRVPALRTAEVFFQSKLIALKQPASEDYPRRKARGLSLHYQCAVGPHQWTLTRWSDGRLGVGYASEAPRPPEAERRARMETFFGSVSKLRLTFAFAPANTSPNEKIGSVEGTEEGYAAEAWSSGALLYLEPKPGVDSEARFVKMLAECRPAMKTVAWSVDRLDAIDKPPRGSLEPYGMSGELAIEDAFLDAPPKDFAGALHITAGWDGGLMVLRLDGKSSRVNLELYRSPDDRQLEALEKKVGGKLKFLFAD